MHPVNASLGTRSFPGSSRRQPLVRVTKPAERAPKTAPSVVLRTAHAPLAEPRIVALVAFAFAIWHLGSGP